MGEEKERPDSLRPLVVHSFWSSFDWAAEHRPSCLPMAELRRNFA